MPTPFDIPQILQRQTEMNDIIDSTTANLTEQHNAIADDLSTKKRQIAFAYSQQRRNSAYNKILLLLISSLIISIVIYYVNENFKLLPSVMITLIISIIFSISIIWGYYIFLEIMSRSGDNYDELNLGTLDTFGTILEGADTIGKNASIQAKSNTYASIAKNLAIDNAITRRRTSTNARVAKNAATVAGNSAIESGDYADQSNTSAIDANTSSEKADEAAGQSLNSAKNSKSSFYKANHMAHWGKNQARNAIKQQQNVMRQGRTGLIQVASAVKSENNKTAAENNKKFDAALVTLNEAKETLKDVTDIANGVAAASAEYTEKGKIKSQLGFTTIKYAPYY